MERTILEFEQDKLGDWFARLDCGHIQHVRHEPPFTERAWAATEVSRSESIGRALDCIRCDRRELPGGYRRYKQTPVFTVETVPGALLRAHGTKAGIWGRIVVTAGQLEFVEQGEPSVDEIVRAGERTVTRPGLKHLVRPSPDVEFHVEFLAPAARRTRRDRQLEDHLRGRRAGPPRRHGGRWA